MHPVSKTIVVALAGLGLLPVAGGCTPASIGRADRELLGRELHSRGLIVGFEGLQPFSGCRADELVRTAGRRSGLAAVATSGNPKAHMKFIRLAHKHGQPIYIVGYSIGARHARKLAEMCRKESIPVRILVMLDPAYLSNSAGCPKVPDNVARAVFCISGAYTATTGTTVGPSHLQDAACTRVRVETIPYASHGELPKMCTDIVAGEIIRDLRK